MDIQSRITGYNRTQTYANDNKSKAKAKSTRASTTEATKETKETSPAVVLETKSSETTGTTSSSSKTYTVDEKKLNQLYNEHDQKTQQFLTLVNTLFKKQGESSALSELDVESIDYSALREGIANGSIKVDAATISSAKNDVAEDGYYGVEKTSERLLSFAKAISGGDPSKIEELRNAVVKGFEQAAGAWGDDLPQLSKDTFNAALDKFDTWASESGVTLSEIERM